MRYIKFALTRRFLLSAHVVGLLQVASCAVLLCAAATTVCAGTISPNPPGGPWYEFEFGTVGTHAINGSVATPSSGGNSIAADDPPWTFAGPATFTNTDAFNQGDSFDVLDFGAFAFTTPLVAQGTGSSNDPDVTGIDPSYSHASFQFAVGPNSITIVTTASPFQGGNAYFRIDAVPEPSTLVLATLALVAGLPPLARMSRRGRARGRT
jgi:hypothetical protein